MIIDCPNLVWLQFRVVNSVGQCWMSLGGWCWLALDVMVVARMCDGGVLWHDDKFVIFCLYFTPLGPIQCYYELSLWMSCFEGIFSIRSTCHHASLVSHVFKNWKHFKLLLYFIHTWVFQFMSIISLRLEMLMVVLHRSILNVCVCGGWEDESIIIIHTCIQYYYYTEYYVQ